MANFRNADFEFSLKELVGFLVKAWKKTFLFGVAGILIAIAIIFALPIKYQAIMKLQVPELVNSGTGSFDGGMNLEYQATLIMRIKMYKFTSKSKIQGCDHFDILDGMTLLQFVTIFSGNNRGSSFIEIKIKSPSKAQAEQCALSIFETIQDLHRQVLDLYISPSKLLLEKNKLRLNSAEAFLMRTNEFEVPPFLIRIANLDEVNILRKNIHILQSNIMLLEAQEIKVIEPIYYFESPQLNKRITLLIGLLSGLLVGVSYVVGKNFLEYISRPRV